MISTPNALQTMQQQQQQQFNQMAQIQETMNVMLQQIRQQQQHVPQATPHNTMTTPSPAASVASNVTIFVGGLPQEATEKDIKDYFAVFGEVASVNLKKDRMTGRSRRFAFVGFKEVETLNTVLTQDHTIKGQKVAVKKALPQQKGKKRGADANAGRGKKRKIDNNEGYFILAKIKDRHRFKDF